MTSGPPPAPPPLPLLLHPATKEVEEFEEEEKKGRKGRTGRVEDVMKDVERSERRSRYFPGRLTFGLFHGHFPTPFIPQALLKSYKQSCDKSQHIQTMCFFFLS